MAGSLALALVLGLASLSFVMRAAGPLLPNLPAAVTQRTAGLAPALLAALVAIQLTGPNGLLHVDVKLPAVLLAAVLAALRAPFIVCVVAGALVAALLRAVFHVN
ncbi:MAG TPA: AzlD domain-containing protein [Streptosporangiaceae bacterium]|nr:AzlD domain-containing protein [Streptosporangiaceae bacterium]